MKAYYNENDPKTAAWLRQLIADGLLPEGDVDERSIEDVPPSDLDGYSQHHFFAGIGGWPLALRLAEWPDDEPVWTGSCPCQPFSQAGRGGGFDDERHLWPAWQWLIEQRLPGTVFGEQVTRGGNAWFDLVSDDMEGMGYTVRAAILPACSIGAPHIRERIFWMGNRKCARLEIGSEPEERSGIVREQRRAFGTSSSEFRLADAACIRGSDGRQRFVEPGILPLAYGVPKRVVRISGYGNAIVPQVAAEFIKGMRR